MELRRGTLLGGRVRHAQPAGGHRTGIEPVLLAACVPARPGERVLEGGTGSGAAMLCLGWRVPGIAGFAVERDAAMAEVARGNLRDNGLADIAVVAADLADFRPDGGAFDHAFANPPWHAPSGTASPDPAREAARRAVPGLFQAWTGHLAAALRHRGTLTLVVGAGAVPECLEGFAQAGCGSFALLPLWPRAGQPARLALLRGIKGGRAPFRLLPGLVLHEPDGRFTETANAVLSAGAALPL